MYQRFVRYAPFLLFVVIAAVGCDRAPAGPTLPSMAGGPQASITAEPLSARPELLPTPNCSTRPAFGVRVTIIIGGGPELLLRELRFHFIDRSGSRTLPEVIPIPTPSATSPLPSSSPISIPGIARLPASSPVAGALPFFVRFGCDVIPDGTLIVTWDASDEVFGLSELRIRVDR